MSRTSFQFGKRNQTQQSWDGNFLNFNEELYISDVNTKWGVTSQPWGTRMSFDKTTFFLGQGSSYSLNITGNSINDWTLKQTSAINLNRACDISPDGTKLFGGIFNMDRFTLPTPLSFSGATSDSYNNPGRCEGMSFSLDGYTMIASIGSANALYEYTVTTPFSFAGITQIATINLSYTPSTVRFYNSGKNALIMQNGIIRKYTLPNLYSFIDNVSDGIVINISDILQGTSGVGMNNIEIDEDKKRMYFFDPYGKAWEVSYQTA